MSKQINMSIKELTDLKEIAVQKSNKEKEWYKKNIRRKRKASKTLRALTIIIVGAGTLCPLIDSTGVINEFELSKWGYVAFAVAGIFIGYDRFFGISSGWIRYTLALFEINRIVNEFEYTWANSIVELVEEPLSKEKVSHIIEILKKFSVDISNVKQEETQTWAVEFESTLLELRRTTSNNNDL